MATFDEATVGADVCPDFPASKASKPEVRSSRFGSGYEQRTTLGINQNPKKWRLEWANRTTSDVEAIEAFFDARAGTESFDWTPPDSTTSYKWVCKEWNKAMEKPAYATITATFEQVFEA
jgi:phage-related protein